MAVENSQNVSETKEVVVKHLGKSNENPMKTSKPSKTQMEMGIPKPITSASQSNTPRRATTLTCAFISPFQFIAFYSFSRARNIMPTPSHLLIQKLDSPRNPLDSLIQHIQLRQRPRAPLVLQLAIACTLSQRTSKPRPSILQRL